MLIGKNPETAGLADSSRQNFLNWLSKVFIGRQEEVSTDTRDQAEEVLLETLVDDGIITDDEIKAVLRVLESGFQLIEVLGWVRDDSNLDKSAEKLIGYMLKGSKDKTYSLGDESKLFGKTLLARGYVSELPSPEASKGKKYSLSNEGRNYLAQLAAEEEAKNKTLSMEDIIEHMKSGAVIEKKDFALYFEGGRTIQLSKEVVDKLLAKDLIVEKTFEVTVEGIVKKKKEGIYVLSET